MNSVLRDLAYAARQLRNAPGFALAAIATLALGIGANAAIFSVVYGLLIKSLPFHDAGQIIAILETHPRIPGSIEATYPDFLDWRAQQRSFDQLAAYSIINPNTVSLRLSDRTEPVRRVLASGNFFSVLGVAPLLGRTLNQQDELSAGSQVAVLGYGAWQRYFGADPRIVGRTVELSGSTFTVVGVLPARGEFPADGEVWLPLTLLDKPTQASRVWHSVRVVGRLRQGISVSAANAEMQAVAARLAKSYPATNRDVAVHLSPLRDQLIGTIRPALLCVTGSVVLVLLIACVNVANLLLVRAARSERDSVIREALGASRARLLSQHLALTTLICLAGGCLGTLLALTLLPLIRLGLSHASGVDLSMVPTVRLNLPVIASTLAICAATAFLFGMLPLLGRRSSFSGSAIAGDRGHTAQHATRQSLLIGAEIATAVVVAFLSFLMIRSYQRLSAVDPGYRTDHLLSFEMELPQPHYQDGSPDTHHFYDQLIGRLGQIPGVHAAASTTQVPLHPSLVMTRFLVDGEAPIAPGTYPVAQIRSVTPDFFSTAGIRMESGRTFTRDELNNEANVFVVNHSFVEHFLGKRNPLGTRIVLGVLSPQPSIIPIVGVVSDAREVGVTADAPPELFLPAYGVHEVLLVRTDNDPHALIPAVQSLVRQIDPGQSVYHFQTLGEVVSDSTALQRVTTLLLAGFAALALILATIGIYGVLSYSVAQRTREIGVRMALGAQRADIVALFLRRVCAFSLAGAVIGLVVAQICARAFSGLLFNTSLADPLALVLTVCALFAVSALAVAVPAGRAARLNPTEALRTE